MSDVAAGRFDVNGEEDVAIEWGLLLPAFPLFSLPRHMICFDGILIKEEAFTPRKKLNLMNVVKKNVRIRYIRIRRKNIASSRSRMRSLVMKIRFRFFLFFFASYKNYMHVQATSHTLKYVKTIAWSR